MAQVFLQYSTPRGVALHQAVAKVTNVTELREYVVQSIRSLITAPSLEDWRQWTVHARDDLGSELFVLPFVSLLGEPH